jgi:hypothetical protein
MNGPTLVATHVHVDQFRAAAKQCFNLFQVSRAYGADEAFRGGTVHERFQLGPTRKSICARNDELRIVQCEKCRVRGMIVRVHLVGRVRLSGTERIQQFFGLPLELGEVRVLAKDASWE